MIHWPAYLYTLTLLLVIVGFSFILKQPLLMHNIQSMLWTPAIDDKTDSVLANCFIIEDVVRMLVAKLSSLAVHLYFNLTGNLMVTLSIATS